MDVSSVESSFYLSCIFLDECFFVNSFLLTFARIAPTYSNLALAIQEGLLSKNFENLHVRSPFRDSDDLNLNFSSLQRF